MSGPKVPTAEQIAQRAFGLYLERGGEDGHDLEDWLAAERELSDMELAMLLEQLSAVPGNWRFHEVASLSEV
jgi:hypothetical protein